MGLAVAQIRLLTLTARKADCEYGISVNSMEKMALTREMNELTRQYNSKLCAKNVGYYNGTKFNKVDYHYLMGSQADVLQIMKGNALIKDDCNMILTDYKGLVVLSDNYANIIKSVCGSDIMDVSGRGGTFSQEEIAKMLTKLSSGAFTEEEITNGIKEYTVNGHSYNTMDGEVTGSVSINTTTQQNSKLQNFIDFYYPIFQSAASNGWTTEYNTPIAKNENYVSDALTSGTFQLFGVNEYGQYDEGTSLNYFVTSGLLEQKSDADERKLVEAWYEEEKAIITEKEEWIDLETQELSTQLESAKTEMQALESFIKDAIQSVFDWGSS